MKNKFLARRFKVSARGARWHGGHGHTGGALARGSRSHGERDCAGFVVTRGSRSRDTRGGTTVMWGSWLRGVRGCMGLVWGSRLCGGRTRVALARGLHKGHMGVVLARGLHESCAHTRVALVSRSREGCTRVALGFARGAPARAWAQPVRAQVPARGGGRWLWKGGGACTWAVHQRMGHGQ